MSAFFPTVPPTRLLWISLVGGLGRRVAVTKAWGRRPGDTGQDRRGSVRWHSVGFYGRHTCRWGSRCPGRCWMIVIETRWEAVAQSLDKQNNKQHNKSKYIIYCTEVYSFFWLFLCALYQYLFSHFTPVYKQLLLDHFSFLSKNMSCWAS